MKLSAASVEMTPLFGFKRKRGLGSEEKHSKNNSDEESSC
jgi:hypothetical protein